MVKTVLLESAYVWPRVLLVSVIKIAKNMMSAVQTLMPHSANEMINKWDRLL